MGIPYSDERVVKYGECNWWEVPPHPSLFWNWLCMLKYIKEDKEERQRLSDAKKNCPSYNVRYWRKTRSKK